MRSLPTDLALTPRQRQIVRMTWGGMTLAEMATALGVTRETVNAALDEAYRRLGVEGRGDPRTMAAVWLFEWEYPTWAEEHRSND